MVDKKVIADKQIEPVIEKVDKIRFNTSDDTLKETTIVKEIKATVNDAKKSTNNVIAVKQAEPPMKKEPTKITNASIKCPDKRVLEYKEKSNNAPDQSSQKAYSWLSLYYTYKCECEKGSPRSDQLVPVINNVVDSYATNTNSAFGKISKVTKCTSPETNR